MKKGKNKYYSSPGQQTSLEDESPLNMKKQTSITNYISIVKNVNKFILKSCVLYIF